MHTLKRSSASLTAMLLVLTSCGGGTPPTEPNPVGTLTYTLTASQSHAWAEEWASLEPYDVNTQFETTHNGYRRMSWGTSLHCEFTVFDTTNCTGTMGILYVAHSNDHQEYRQPEDGSAIHIVRDFSSDENGAAQYPVATATITPSGFGITTSLPIGRSARSTTTCTTTDPSNPTFCDDKRTDESTSNLGELPVSLGAQFVDFPESLPTTPGTLSGIVAVPTPNCTARNVIGERGAYDRVTCTAGGSGSWTLVTRRQ